MVKIKSLLGNIALVCVSISLTAVAAEFLVRHFLPQKLYRFPQGMFRQLPNGEYALAPDFSGLSATVEYETVISTNSLGLRENQEFSQVNTKTSRMLIIGDSFTMGVGVDHEDTFIEKLEQSMTSRNSSRRYEIVNSGVPGYNTHAALAQLERMLPTLDPGFVLLAYFVGNDVIDNYDGIPTIVEDGFLRRSRSSPGLLPNSLRSFLQRHSHLYQLLWPMQKAIRDPTFREQRIKSAARSLSIYDTRPTDELDAIWESTKSELRRFADISRNAGITAGVIIIPERLQTDTALWMTAMEMLPNEGAGHKPEQPNLRIQDICDELSIPVFDLLRIFKERNNTKNMYYPVDGHWTTAGNSLAANSLESFVRTLFDRVPSLSNASEIKEER